MRITSSAFDNNKIIPARFTCKGDDVSPPLQFEEIPNGTKSLALLVDDLDAFTGTWVHWLIYNIDPTVRTVAENEVPQGAVLGMTSFGSVGYGGPCPPSGTHRYFFKLFALNKFLPIDEKFNKETLLKNIRGAVIEKAELVGLYCM